MSISLSTAAPSGPVLCRRVWLLLLLNACERPCADPASCDLDGDGITADADCDDDDPSVGLGADWYPDCDEDGVASDEPIRSCEVPDTAALFDLCGGGGVWRGEDEPRGDCDDADVDASEADALVFDCDGDGAFGTAATVCGDLQTSDVEVICGVDEADSASDVAAGDCDDDDPDVFPGAPDLADGIDSDCDGLDFVPLGDADGAFVAEGGTGTECFQADPCPTLSQGVNAAVTRSLDTVYVANGTIDEVLTVQVSVDVRGGYDPATWVRAPGETRIVKTSNDPIFNVLFVDVTLERLTLVGQNSALRARSGTLDLLDVRFESSVPGQPLSIDDTAAVTATNLTGEALESVIWMSGGTLDVVGCDLVSNSTNNGVAPLVMFGVSTEASLTDCRMSGMTGASVSTGPSLTVVDSAIEASYFGIDAQNGTAVRIEQTAISVCADGPNPTACYGMKSSGDVVLDGVTMTVAEGGLTRGIEHLGVGRLTVVDSVLRVAAPTRDAVGIDYAAFPANDLIVANSVVEVNGDDPDSTLLAASSANVVLWNNVFYAPTNADAASVELSSATLDLRSNRVARSAGAAIRRFQPDGDFTWAEVADDCSVLAELCTEASGNTVGEPGFVDAESGDYALSPGAFCIDVGTDTSPWVDEAARAFDLLGNPRTAPVDCGPTEAP